MEAEIGVGPGAFAEAYPGPVKQPGREALLRIAALEERVARLEADAEQADAPTLREVCWEAWCAGVRCWSEDPDSDGEDFAKWYEENVND